MDRPIIESQHTSPDWLAHLGQPVASGLLAWEQAQADMLLADVFGYHAVQLGWPELQALRCNRMPHRWQAGTEFEWPRANKALHGLDHLEFNPSVTTPAEGVSSLGPQVWLDSRAWPWQADSLDLVVLPHTLERSADPHACLREVERVLIPEGQVLITGLNPLSLWGWSAQREALRSGSGTSVQSLIAYRRLRDWLRLLGFEVQVSRFWGWTPALSSERWLQRMSWMARAGERWWPILGGVYLLVATKRVPGGHWLPARQWRKVRSPASAPAPVARSDTFMSQLQSKKDAFDPR
ncbi:MAG: class I SAM-dependent methyltransferase [Limnohabitans sp.]|jgi:SAM-dependent methyltransferase|nr:class I SAM-dependent methyltransferase [Limnohabitans sp.]MDP4733142.1 class I SAM-dependent methyltransferase [Limnohabitans sp.]MDP4773167.1 class I SAM-dependent methyltransferase [Limnohabitans sp.]MDP4923984.1 class I SAM-dependent methyltransferase [Limnohabitans sp.]